MINNILEMLSEDMMSYGFLAQLVDHSDSNDTFSHLRVKDLLTDLLSSGKVEIGMSKLATPNYVEFIAWRGTVEERVRRAMKSIASASGPDKEFTFWLCLSGNVDRFEGEASRP